LDVSELPPPDAAVEVLVKQITSSQEDFDDSLDAFKEAYLDNLADYESNLSANFRMNIVTYDDIDDYYDLVQSIASDPDAAVDHSFDFNLRCDYVTYRMD